MIEMKGHDGVHFATGEPSDTETSGHINDVHAKCRQTIARTIVRHRIANN